MAELYADKGFAPLLTGHEPVMLLLHQSALIFMYLLALMYDILK